MTGKFSVRGSSFLLLLFISFFFIVIVCGSFTYARAEPAKETGVNAMLKSFAREMAFIKTFSSDMPVQYKQEKSDTRQPAYHTQRLGEIEGSGEIGKRQESPEIKTDIKTEEQGKTDSQGEQAQVKTFQDTVLKIQARPDETVNMPGNTENAGK